ncbi:UbiX family flavin prenyltransferase [Sulfurospirillum sp. T05]|uniref:Flavin prenyltransferase UbiX n=1 Tax=Sulfurospirillum tamanense TaxID=2813362 RepID=A0ABS2WSF5_9BACT|nr:UbiX family flavin prenyltransferase [Sulfurospirillum tamanensis]MBN2964594.1 UbiX family flavin prenyltransferase [Sulfurospirillum tamanensis]
MKRLIVGISGASGVTLGKRFVELLPKDVQVYVILSEHAKVVFKREEGVHLLDDQDIGGVSASGSFQNDGMIVVPCSMNSLAKIACGIADTLLTRTASVMLKEKRPLVLAPREMPFGTIALENMHKLSALGVVIAPPVLGYYAKPESLEMMEDFLIGKWFDLLGIPHALYQRWQG